jgi:nucleotide-binding universal stress UspA family protein
VVAFYGGETSTHALAYACRFAAERGLTLDILHVAAEGTDAETMLAVARQVAAPSSVTVRTHALGGDIVAAVSDWVARSGADLLVAGTHGGRGMPWPLGSHAEKLIRATVVPVLIHR